MQLIRRTLQRKVREIKARQRDTNMCRGMETFVTLKDGSAICTENSIIVTNYIPEFVNKISTTLNYDKNQRSYLLI